MNIRKLNEQIQKVLREWQEFSSDFAVRLVVKEPDVPKLLAIASKTGNSNRIEAILKSKGIPFTYETIIDEDSFEANSVEELVNDIKSYYEDFYSSVDISSHIYDEVEIDDEEVNIGHLGVSLYDDEGYDEEEYDDEEYDEELNEHIESILEEGKDYQQARELGYSDAQDFNIGDKVRVIWNKRPGIITKQIAVDVYEVELPEYGANMARTDRYYANDLELLKEV